MKNTLVKTNYHFPGQTAVYYGKVRDMYTIENDTLVMIVTDRISAFDVILPEGIPYKGQVLNQIANKFLDATSDIVPNWKTASPDPMVTVGIRCEPIKWKWLSGDISPEVLGVNIKKEYDPFVAFLYPTE